MAGRLTLRVITPDAIVLDTTASAVRLPGADGSLGVLPRHAHMVAAVRAGPLRYRQNGTESVLFVSDGFAEVRDDTLRVVAEAGELPEEIDEARAREAEARARERLAQVRQRRPDVDEIRAEMALRRALMRLHVLSYGSRERRAPHA